MVPLQTPFSADPSFHARAFPNDFNLTFAEIAHERLRKAAKNTALNNFFAYKCAQDGRNESVAQTESPVTVQFLQERYKLTKLFDQIGTWWRAANQSAADLQCLLIRPEKANSSTKYML